MSIYTEMHKKYGSPTHVAEFRLFALNDCYKSCENCFYKRSGNHIENFSEIAVFARELSSKGYQLETCYLLPTDFFENEDNYILLGREDVREVVNQFLYLGIASTLEGDLEFRNFKELVASLSIKEVEVQVNLINEKIFLESYFLELKENIKNLRLELNGKVVFNLALNLGKEISDQEYERIQYFVKELSDDGILEINFTFLYNDKINHSLKSKKLLKSLKSMNKIGRMYNLVESRYNERTMLRKPAFIFKDQQVFIAPIVPFDEYAFVDNRNYALSYANFDAFLSTMNRLEKENKPIIDNCIECDNLNVCMGKGYFITARAFNLPCFLEV